ncbi:hypothetical protein AgCh_026566 [Apium graveolens]
MGHVTVLCHSPAESFVFGTINLPSGFFTACSDIISERATFHAPNKKVWSDFKIQIFDCYGLEIGYLESCTYCRNDSIAIDVLASTNKFSVLENFTCHHKLVITTAPRMDDSWSEVLCEFACYQLDLKVGRTNIMLGFESHMWKIGVKWVNKCAYFDHMWDHFLDSAHIDVGDTLAIRVVPTLDVCDMPIFKVVVFPPSVLKKDDFVHGLDVITSYERFYKFVTLNALEFGHLEIPHAFVAKYGDRISNPLNISLGGGYRTSFMYSHCDRKIHGLKVFFEQYEVLDEYVIIFYYFGEANFSVEANLIGNAIDEDMQMVLVSESTDKGGSESDLDINSIAPAHNNSDQGSDSDDLSMEEQQNNNLIVLDSDSDESSVEEQQNNIPIDDNVRLAEEPSSFVGLLSQCHVGKKFHGVDIGRDLFPIYFDWGKRTNTILTYGGRDWNVEVLKNGRRCRFSIGWKEFVVENNFLGDNQLLFVYRGNFNFLCRVMTTIYGDHGVSMSKRYNGVSKLWDKQFIKDGNGGVAFVALIIIQSYTASLSSMLIAQSLEPIVKDVATLMKMNATTGYFQRSFLRSYIIGTLGFDPAKVRKYPSTAAGYAKALNTKEIVRIIFEVPPAKVFLAQYCKSFIKSDRTFKDEGFGFKAFEKGFPLLPGINNAIMNITESGKLLELEKKYINSEECVDADTISDAEASIGLNSFSILFMLTGCTSTIVLVMFVF